MTDEPRTMPYLIFRIRQTMFKLGDLPSIDAAPAQILSNGQILNRLKEINGNPQIDGDHDQPKSGGEAE